MIIQVSVVDNQDAETSTSARNLSLYFDKTVSYLKDSIKSLTNQPLFFNIESGCDDLRGEFMDLGLFRTGLALKQYRNEKSLTLSDLAEKTGLECSTVSAIEGGRFDGSITELLRYLYFANFELAHVSGEQSFPQLHELSLIFGED